MAYKQLKDINSVDLETSFTTTSGATSDWYGMPNRLSYAALQLIPSGTARVEVTLDRDGAMQGTAVPIAWSHGDVTEVKDELVRGAAAIRVVSTSGDAVLHIRGTRG